MFIAITVLPLTREWIEICTADMFRLVKLRVLPLTREWIEIKLQAIQYSQGTVLPLTREWIEIADDALE